MYDNAICIGSDSALRFWRSVRSTGGSLQEHDAADVFGARALGAAQRVSRARDLCLCDEGQPLDSVNGGPFGRCYLIDVCNHKWRAPLGSSQLVCIEDGIFVCRPSVVIAQLGSELDEISLAQVSCELMGTYGLVPWTDEDIVCNVNPLASLSDCREYAVAAHTMNVRGATRALEALRISSPNSASPRETDVAIYFQLGRPHGGAGLDGFAMNQKLAVPKELWSLAGQHVIKPDFCWQGAKVICEYDSDEDHLNSRQKTKDERRRATLEAMGYKVMTLTNGILKSNEALNAFTAELERQLGVRRNPMSAKMLAQRRELRNRLFGSALGRLR
ncbi:DUF559 domain-containing protein [Olsenella sp. kh2p3]|uniref:DUF559 domain-containing protein n=1 Tax=Olsenella sp. kh2p3 TaxID=1797112 RepID=UPI00091BDF35|nr:DUF559 domain-containing protein [Olsenella sp. kh2p3]SFX64492.1 Protein of unknown function [Olsenella sp. kh2p3]